MNWCTKCGAFIFLEDAHRCDPQWCVWNPEHDPGHEHARPIHALNAEFAAEKWAEQEDGGGDYTIVSGSPEVVHVKPWGEDGPVQRFRVSGEMVAQYSADEIEE